MWKTTIFSLGLIVHVLGHGRLRDPPGRSSAWRDNFPIPQNDNDHELFCGGFQVQHGQNGGKCGICGDAWHLSTPRPNELGGTYGSGILTRNYTKAQIIDVFIELTTSHKGWFELRLCPLDSSGKDATQECFDQHVLQEADGSSGRISVGDGPKNYTLKMQLPNDITCQHCVIQWHYNAGNNWGVCPDLPDGQGRLGCGPQETFRACADVGIN